jgi:hypothetical protein
MNWCSYSAGLGVILNRVKELDLLYTLNGEMVEWE